jgi:hypothetical protein
MCSKFVIKHAQSGIMAEKEMEIHATNLSSEPSALVPDVGRLSNIIPPPPQKGRKQLIYSTITDSAFL